MAIPNGQQVIIWISDGISRHCQNELTIFCSVQFQVHGCNFYSCEGAVQAAFHHSRVFEKRGSGETSPPSPCPHVQAEAAGLWESTSGGKRLQSGNLDKCQHSSAGVVPIWCQDHCDVSLYHVSWGHKFRFIFCLIISYYNAVYHLYMLYCTIFQRF